MALIDYTAAFDKVWHDGLIHKMINLGLPTKYVRWIKSFLTNRQSRVKVQDSLSRARNFRCGVPQGSVLSPRLFNIFTADLPNVASNVEVAAYADDVAIWKSGNNNIEDASTVQENLQAIKDWSDKWKLTINPTKCEVIHFTPDTRECKYRPACQSMTI
jgi:hypothetical protein